MNIRNAVFSCGVVLVASAWGCTANVENPSVDQTGRGGDTAAVCVKSCDDARTSCVAKCTDDGCRAACSSDHDHCTTECTVVKTDAGAD